MREIKINYPENFSNILGSQIQQAAAISINATMQVAKQKWEGIAQDKLTTTRTDYLLGLNADDSMQFPDAFTGVLTLRGKWPNMLEEGFQAYDMKEGLLEGPNAKRTKDGKRYNIVPFRHRTPNQVGSAVGGSSMPEDIYAKAKVMASKERLRGTETKYPPGTSWTGYQHKSGLYEGMKRNIKQYDKAVQSTYTTFRVVSDNSDASSWWHPGFEGVKALSQVEPYAQRIFDQVFADNIKNLMG